MKKIKRPVKNRKKRGIYILPNLFTTLNIFCGFFSIIATVDGKFISAGLAIIIAGVFDALDGKIARAAGATSQFGLEFDSLADIISFGIAPALMMYIWALKPMGRIGWLAGFLFVACGALRLARFNTQTGSTSNEYFNGLPIPGAAGMCAVTVLFCHRLGIDGTIHPILILIMLYVLSFLMVSTIKYYSFKKQELFHKIKFNVLVAIILVMIFIASQPSIALFLFGLIYIVSGPFITLRYIRQKKYENALVENIENQHSDGT